MQNYSFDLFLAKLPSKMNPNDTTACYNNLEIIKMVFKSQRTEISFVPMWELPIGVLNAVNIFSANITRVNFKCKVF